MTLEKTMERFDQMRLELEDVRKDVQQEHAKLDNKKQELEAAKKELEDMQERMRDTASHAKHKVRLNVGGRLFVCTKDTLLVEENTFFWHLLAGANWKPDEDGEYFIDRDPRHFDVILNYFRKGRLDLDLASMRVKERLAFYDEVEYFKVHSLLKNREADLAIPPPDEREIVELRQLVKQVAEQTDTLVQGSQNLAYTVSQLVHAKKSRQEEKEAVARLQGKMLILLFGVEGSTEQATQLHDRYVEESVLHNGRRCFRGQQKGLFLYWRPYKAGSAAAWEVGEELPTNEAEPEPSLFHGDTSSDLPEAAQRRPRRIGTVLARLEQDVAAPCDAPSVAWMVRSTASGKRSSSEAEPENSPGSGVEATFIYDPALICREEFLGDHAELKELTRTVRAQQERMDQQQQQIERLIHTLVSGNNPSGGSAGNSSGSGVEAAMLEMVRGIQHAQSDLVARVESASAASANRIPEAVRAAVTEPITTRLAELSEAIRSSLARQPPQSSPMPPQQLNGTTRTPQTQTPPAPQSQPQQATQQQQQQSQPPLNRQQFDSLPPQQQKHFLGQQVFRRLSQKHPPQLAGSVTDVILDLENEDIIAALANPTMFEERARTALAWVQQQQGGR
eukprot:TRINITY_DN4023_c0_g1_i1.p1 TRINITY_DN4023_c0_g1~~TRINITY_DN4023_c0_g1_i1.p1  ORF type:complete len:619 (+),score=138.41 TRINITY_DN4023_c0_g1_i1:65-1921(+)